MITAENQLATILKLHNVERYTNLLDNEICILDLFPVSKHGNKTYLHVQEQNTALLSTQTQ
jgi:hypothetical protein